MLRRPPTRIELKMPQVEDFIQHRKRKLNQSGPRELTKEERIGLPSAPPQAAPKMQH